MLRTCSRVHRTRLHRTRLALDDVELEELNRSIEIDANELQVEPDQAEGDIDAVQANRGQKYVGQGNGDKTVWWSMATEEEKMRTELLKRDRMSSFAHCTRSFDGKKDAFMHIFPPAIIEQIVLETNRKARKELEANRHVQQPKNMRPWKDTNADELYAYIAILIYAGAEKANLVQAKDLFASSNMPFYRAVMSLYRYEQLTRYLRFDDCRTRLARLRTDKLAPIRYIWDFFLKNLTSAFVPSLELCIDEQLLVTRNRCSFRQYIPSKPGKYGIKIFWLVDAKKNYPISGEIYLGTQPTEARNNSIAKNLVMRLSKNYLNIGSNITMDNFFTSYQLATELAAKNTTIVGTIRVNKRELPKAFASVAKAKERAANSAVFCFSNECELVSYVTRTKKNVCLLSTAHATEDLNPETGKPVVVHDYNEHKGGVDTLDKMLRCYTTKRKNDRWPMLLFCNMIDVGAFAAYRLFELSHPAYRPPNYKKRKSFLKDLAFELAGNHLKSRSEMPRMRSSVKIALALIGIKTENIRNSRTMPQIQVKKYSLKCIRVCNFKQISLFLFLSFFLCCI